MSETDLVRQSMDALRAHGIPCWRVNVSGVRGRKQQNRGMADIHAVVPPEGGALWIECKVGKGKQSPEQVEFQDAVRVAGGIYLLVRDVAELNAILNQRRS
jgi:hypothetical protein